MTTAQREEQEVPAGAENAPFFPEQIRDAIMCPVCKGDLAIRPTSISCQGCSAEFPIKDGVPLLAVEGTADTWDQSNTGGETSEAYQQQYQQLDDAVDYNQEYKQEFLKRMSTKREFALLNQLLKSQGISSAILDLPCGGGRLSPQIAAHTELLVEADIAAGQVIYGKQHMMLPTQQFWMTASAFHIPFRDDSIDGIVCPRLNHHLPTAIERERLVEELLRVAKRFVIMTFFDHASLKNRLRLLRQPFDKQPPKMTMTVSRVRELARENGADLVTSPALAPLSGHRYALMVKKS